MSKLTLCVFALIAVLQTSDPVPPPREQVTSFTYRFEQERFIVSRIDLKIDTRGEGRLVFVRKGLTRPVERPVRITEGVARQLDELVSRLGFFASHEVYQTADDHSNLGSVTLAASRAGLTREVVFNFTENRDMATLASTLRGIANREMFAFDLETAVRFQPLETPHIISALDNEIELGRITDPLALAPLLREIADDVSLPLIARNRAGALAGRIAASK
jgi:hypothetical protein